MENKLYKNSKFVQEIDGCWFPCTPEGLEIVQNMECKEEDIWINTYPKSGTVWTHSLVDAILYNGDIKKLNEDKEKLVVMQRKQPIEIRCSLEGKSALDSASPCVISSHLPYRLFPPKAHQNKIIQIIRNPKDVGVSFFHFHQMVKLLHYEGNWEDFFEYYLIGQVSYGSWFDFVLDWWEHKLELPNLLILHFEDMKKDLKSAVEKIAKFLNKELNEEAVNNITEYGSFSSMKKSKAVDQMFDKGSVSNPLTSFLRKGEIGDWKNHFTKDQNERFDSLFAERMKNTDLKVTFE